MSFCLREVLGQPFGEVPRQCHDCGFPLVDDVLDVTHALRLLWRGQLRYKLTRPRRRTGGEAFRQSSHTPGTHCNCSRAEAAEVVVIKFKSSPDNFLILVQSCSARSRLASSARSGTLLTCKAVFDIRGQHLRVVRSFRYAELGGRRTTVPSKLQR